MERRTALCRERLSPNFKFRSFLLPPTFSLTGLSPKATSHFVMVHISLCNHTHNSNHGLHKLIYYFQVRNEVRDDKKFSSVTAKIISMIKLAETDILFQDILMKTFRSASLPRNLKSSQEVFKGKISTFNRLNCLDTK